MCRQKPVLVITNSETGFCLPGLIKDEVEGCSMSILKPICC